MRAQVLGRVCASCGRPLLPAARFCHVCGARAPVSGASASMPPQPSIEGPFASWDSSPAPSSPCPPPARVAAVCRFARPSGVVLFLAGVISAIVVALLWLVVTAYNTRSIQSAPPATADQGVSTPGGSNEVPAPARSRAASTGLPSAVQVNVAQANLNEGDRLWHAERPGQAVDCWLRASRSAPGSRPSDAAGSRLAEVAEQAYRSGESYYRAGDLARARELLDAARRARPGSAWSQRADALWNQIATPLSPP